MIENRESRVREGISWVISVIVGTAIMTGITGVAFYILNWLLAYAVNIPMLEYSQLCALGLACVLIKSFFKYL